MSCGEITTLVIALLGLAGTVGVAFYKIHYLELEVKSRKLEIGQIRQKIVKLNQVNIDILLKSKIDEKAKEELKEKLDEINSDWRQYLDGGDVEGASFSYDNKSETKP